MKVKGSAVVVFIQLLLVRGSRSLTYVQGIFLGVTRLVLGS